LLDLSKPPGIKKPPDLLRRFGYNVCSQHTKIISPEGKDDDGDDVMRKNSCFRLLGAKIYKKMVRRTLDSFGSLSARYEKRAPGA
jgi:hypothetical protein